MKVSVVKDFVKLFNYSTNCARSGSSLVEELLLFKTVFPLFLEQCTDAALASAAH